MLNELGFETVDTTDMALRNQIELFRQTSVLVAVHGAGLTTMMFRAGHPMTVIELCSDVWASEDFRRLARDLAYDFTRLVFPAERGVDPQHADFAVDTSALAAVLPAP
jgi:capsular polysaccharide biosynthesis protein